MAYKDSDELKTDERYPLGDYSFRIERSSVPGSTNDKIEAVCTQGSKSARKSIQVPSSTKLLGWYVEANSSTADVYIVTKGQSPAEGVPHPVNYGTGTQQSWLGSTTRTDTVPGSTCSFQDSSTTYWFDKVPFDLVVYTNGSLSSRTSASLRTVYDKPIYLVSYGRNDTGSTYAQNTGHANNYDFYSVLYGELGQEDTVLVGRFAIELEDAGGTGPGSDWGDPGDWDDDWEPGEPTHTLNVEIDGALSGRHNDPLNDTSYSYIPADKATVKDYGCGGDGGNGGGGGGGASNIVVYKFATNKANSKEIVCRPKRHGYGSGGGKGGKGGDGCILVYY